MNKNTDWLIAQLEAHIESNLNNDQFGVRQLAELMHMSRSHLHRKLQKAKGKSISKFIREYRLKKAKQLLIEKDITASEAAYAVGFGSPSYFNKCYTEFYGYSPGKARQRMIEASRIDSEKTNSRKQLKGRKKWWPAFSEKIFSTLGFGQSPHKNTIAGSSSATLFEKKSIIVLPFKNLSSNVENQYLADGMVDAISRHLSGIEDFKVISSSASVDLNSIKEIGEKLGVSNVVHGSLQQQDGTVRIEIKLVKTSDESQVWAQKYDRRVLDVLEIQSDISKRVAQALEANISVKERSILAKRTSYDPLAYDNYLKGMYYMNQFGKEGLSKSLAYFEKAIAIDSSIAPAYAATANIYHMKASIFSATINSKEALRNAEHYLDFALKLDKDWHFNFTMKAFQLTFFHWNFEEADKNYQIGLKAKKPLNYIMYRDFLQFENRHEEALKVSLTIDCETPFYPNSSLILSYFYNGMYDEGKAYIDERLPSFPTHYLIYDNFGFFLLNIGSYKRAVELFRKAIDLGGNRFPRILAWTAAAHAHMGEIQKARRLLYELKGLKKETDAGSPGWFVAVIYSALGEKMEALKWIEMSIDDHEMEIPWLVSEPQFYPLHGMPEFDALVKRVGFREHAYPAKLPERLLSVASK